MRLRCGLAALAVGALLLTGVTQGAQDARDFSGVWQAFASQPATGVGGENSLGTDGRIRVADFSARYPNLIDPDSYCVPSGMPTAMTTLAAAPIEITQTPTRLVIFAARENQYRRVFIDDRNFPVDQPATRMGYSVGRWDGNTLVVETGLLSEMLTGRLPRTAETVVVERIAKMTRSQVSATAAAATLHPAVDEQVLAFTITITDPTLYKQPQALTVYYQHVDDNLLPESNCTADLWRQALDAANP